MTTPSCSVPWCQVREEGNTWHQSRPRYVFGNFAEGMDSPEYEGLLLTVMIEGETARPRLGIGVPGERRTLTVRLSEDATEVVRNLLA